MRGQLKAILVLGIIALFLPFASHAAEQRPPEIKAYNLDNRAMVSSFYSAHPDYRGGASVAAGDFDGDGQVEIAVAPGPDSPPWVKVFEQNGAITSEFLAYGLNFRLGLYLAAGDLDNDGIDEIITGARAGGGPHVRVFDYKGNVKLTPGFFAYDQNFRGGVRVAVGDVNGDGYGEIITGPAVDHEPNVYVFDRFGNRMPIDFYPFTSQTRGGVSVGAGDVDNDGLDEIVTAVAGDAQAWIKTYNYDAGKTIVGNFLAYPPDHMGGVNVTVGQADNGGPEEIFAAVNRRGGPQVRFFTPAGKELVPSIFAYESTFSGGVFPAAGDLNGDGQDEVIAGPGNNSNTPNGDRIIEVDLTTQTLYAKQGGVVVRAFKISSGLPSKPSPTGNFTVFRKLPVHLYSGVGYYLPGVKWNLNFLPGYYIHGTYWHSNFGHPMSHGCINMRTSEVEWLYNNFATVGTKVKIYGSTPRW